MPAADLLVHPTQAPRLASRQGVQVREDSVYTNHKGDEKNAIRKRADKALDKLQEALARALKPDETVLHLARCQAPAGAFEQLAFGWYIYYVTGTVLVFTNRRLLHFLITRDGTWKRSLRAVAWGDLKEAKAKGWLSPTLKLKYASGKKETYWGLRRDDAKKIKVLLGVLLPGSTGESTPAQAMVSLCPDCLAALTPRVYQCSQCGLGFKDEKTLVRRSLLIPGGGYFYTGHWFLAIGDFLVEAYLLLLLLLFAVDALVPGTLGGGGDAGDRAAAWVLVGFSALILAVEKWFTIHHCRRFVREFIPLKK